MKDRIETRGRPRNQFCEELASQIECIWNLDGLPYFFDLKGRSYADKKANLQKFRNSFAYKDLKKRIGNFKICLVNGQACVENS